MKVQGLLSSISSGGEVEGLALQGSGSVGVEGFLRVGLGLGVYGFWGSWAKSLRNP